MDAFHESYYKVITCTKKLRKRLPVVQLRRAARKPFTISLPPAPGAPVTATPIAANSTPVSAVVTPPVVAL